MVFSSYLHLLEEEQGALLPDIISNSLLLGLVGTWGLQQLAESPVITTLAMATHVAFVQMVAGYFKRLVNTACSDPGVQDQKLESTELDVGAQYEVLESDERSQVDQLTSCSGAPPTSSFHPGTTIIDHSTADLLQTKYFLLRRGRGRADAPWSNCCRVGHSSGTVRCPASGTDQ